MLLAVALSTMRNTYMHNQPAHDTHYIGFLPTLTLSFVVLCTAIISTSTCVLDCMPGPDSLAESDGNEVGDAGTTDFRAAFLQRMLSVGIKWSRQSDSTVQLANRRC